MADYKDLDDNDKFDDFYGDWWDRPPEYWQQVYQAHKMLASDPNTSTEILQVIAQRPYVLKLAEDEDPDEHVGWMASPQDKEIHKLVINHPNTCVSMLSVYFNDYGQPYVNWLKKSPNWSRYLDHIQKRELLCTCDRDPKVLLNLFSKDYSVYYHLASNLIAKVSDPVVLEQLANHPDFLIRCAVAKNPNISLTVLSKLYQIAELDDESDARSLRWAIVQNPKALGPWLVRFFDNDLPNYYAYVIESRQQLILGHPNFPKSVLAILAGNSDARVRAAAVASPNIQAKYLVKLSTDENILVRAAVAGNLKTSLRLLRKLSRDEEFFVRAAVAKNPNTPEKVIEQLGFDGASKVLANRASRKNQ